MPDIKQLTTGIVMALIGVFVGYTLFNSLFSPTYSSVATLNNTLITGGYTNEAGLVMTSFKFYLLAIPLSLLGGAVYFIIKAFSE